MSRFSRSGSSSGRSGLRSALGGKSRAGPRFGLDSRPKTCPEKCCTFLSLLVARRRQSDHGEVRWPGSAVAHGVTNPRARRSRSHSRGLLTPSPATFALGRGYCSGAEAVVESTRWWGQFKPVSGAAERGAHWCLVADQRHRLSGASPDDERAPGQIGAFHHRPARQAPPPPAGEARNAGPTMAPRGGGARRSRAGGGRRPTRPLWSPIAGPDSLVVRSLTFPGARWLVAVGGGGTRPATSTVRGWVGESRDR